MKTLNIQFPSISFASGFFMPAQELSVKRQAWTGLVGSSGSGKTTLLRSLAKSHPRVLYTCQSDRLLPWLNVLDNVMLFSKLQGCRDENKKKKAMEILTFFKLEKFIKSYPPQLSYGMQTRSLLARTLFMDADLYLLDEVFNGLDDTTKEDVIEATQKLLFDKTVIFVSHRLSEIKKTCNEYYTLSGGKMTHHSQGAS